MIAVFVEGSSDAGFIEEVCRRLSVKCKAFVLRGNRVEKAVRKARALVDTYNYILLLKDTHGLAEDTLEKFDKEVSRDLMDLKDKGVVVRVLRVNKSIESWILADLCEENPEDVVDPERRLSERIGKIVVKAEKPYRDIARVIDVDHAIAKSQSFNEFVKALKS